MYETSDIRKGLKFELDGEPYVVLDFQFVKPGKGNAFTRCRLRNMLSGAVLDKTYRSGERLKEAQLEERPAQLMYREDELFHFMDQKTYEQFTLTTKLLGNDRFYLLDEIVVMVLYHNQNPISVNLPPSVELKVKHTDPGLKGDTVSGARKNAVMETDLNVNVPLFIETGEKLKIDTRTGDYMERVK